LRVKSAVSSSWREICEKGVGANRARVSGGSRVAYLKNVPFVFNQMFRAYLYLMREAGVAGLSAGRERLAEVACIFRAPIFFIKFQPVLQPITLAARKPQSVPRGDYQNHIPGQIL
jgi:hypothetical protein